MVEGNDATKKEVKRISNKIFLMNDLTFVQKYLC